MLLFQDICIQIMTRYFIIVFFSLICFQATSQLCQGSLGDPLININFGAGNNPGPSIAAATGYPYVTSDCPDDGFYTVRNNTSNCFGNSWHNLTGDHTGNTNGYFMLVNASIQPTAFYIDTIRGLCGNSTYEFASWIMNVNLPTTCSGNPIQPNLTFSIEKTDATILQTYNSGNIPPAASPVWKQYGFFFITPAAGSDIVVRIINNAPGGCGNDLALDDITFRPCGPQLTPSIAGQTTTYADICEGSNTGFTFNCSVSAGYINPVFQWQQRFNNSAWADIAGANSTSFNKNFIPSNAIGIYDYRLSVAEAGNTGFPQCRISSQPLTVTIHANPVATAFNDGPVCIKSMLTLTATGGSQYTWTGPNGFTATGAVVNINNFQAAQAGTYFVQVSNAAGCSNMASTLVNIKPSPVAAVSFTDASICLTDSIQLSASGGGTYEWFPATALSANTIFDPKASPVNNIRYGVSVMNTAGCRDTAYININVFSKAIANAGPDRNVISGGSVILSGSIQGSYLSFTWSPPVNINNTGQLQPIVKPTGDAFYILTVLSNNGCGISIDSVFVKVIQDIYIPNSFTPNKDGINDQWNIPALDAYQNFEMFIFNRYGELVYKNSQINKGWDGMYKSSLLPTGTYVYIIKLNVSGQVLKGTVMILH